MCLKMKNKKIFHWITYYDYISVVVPGTPHESLTKIVTGTNISFFSEEKKKEVDF